ncbi:MAG: hypothetical protein ACREGK_05380, partial [Geminicoccales bacterium]
RDLRAIRTRIEEAPRASSFDLDRVERDLWEHRLDAPDDPKVLHLEREIRDLRHDADRQLRAPSRDLRDHSGTRQPRSLSDGACWNPRLGRAPCVFRGLETRPFSLY